MAALVATMVVGPLLSIVKEKVSSYLLVQYKVMEGMEDQHKILKRKLPAILDIITDAEQAASHREGVKAWLEEVKTVAYEANEIFDEFKYEALRREAKKNGHYSKLGFDAVKLYPTHNRFVFRDRMGKKLCRVVQAIEVLVTEMNAFGFKYQQQAPASMQWRQTDHVIFDPKKIISRSRSQDTKSIIHTVLCQASNANLTVVPIVGIGGLGKTTLAQLIYNDPEIQKHFELLIWVCVSDSFDVDSLAKLIAESLQGKSTVEAASKRGPLDTLQDVLSGHRYLLVLDDVWNQEPDKWEKLKARLTLCAKGSVVLATTRDEGVAKIMGTVKAYNLAALEDKFIKEIIETRAFSLLKEEERPVVLINMVDEIVKRCRGSPLAAAALGSVLRTKTNEGEWKAISSRSNICTEESGILPVLKLSYNDLSSQMKQCFAFCAVFPKDYEIDVDKLIQLWIAHGFIEEQKGVSPETIGKRIFSALASRSFFVDVKQVQVPSYILKRIVEGSYSILTCKIHDLMHDVALSTMEQECAFVPKKPRQVELLPDTARHLFLSCPDPEPILNKSLVKRSRSVQTLLCDSTSGYELQDLSKYCSLRVLQIQISSRSLPLKSKHLHHLRYLDLSGSWIKAFPEDISMLYNLQTLNVSGCIKLRSLPRQMKYMVALRHLYTHGCPKMKSMPTNLHKLMSLQTLTCFVAGSIGSECSDIGELQQLNIGGQLELHQLQCVTKEDAKAASLGNKKELRELTLKWNFGSSSDARVLEGLKPHDGVQTVRIEFYGGTIFPSWMAMSRNMVEIHLSKCEKLLWLFSCDTSFIFRNLKEFSLKNMKSLERWWELSHEEQGKETIFPKLEKLSIVGCAKLIELPEAALLGESHGTIARSAFPSLKELYLDALGSFCRWEAIKVSQRGSMVFPKLEELTIQICPMLTQLPEAPLGGDYIMAQSVFPALKTLRLYALDSFDKWEAINGTQRGHIVFPKLEKLTIENCPVLTALPEAQFGGDYNSMAHSAFPALKVLKLNYLLSFGGWDPLKEEIMFPQLEELYVTGCRMMAVIRMRIALSGEEEVPQSRTTKGKSPKLSVLDMAGRETEMLEWVATHMTSLTNVRLWQNHEDPNTLSEVTSDDSFGDLSFAQVMDGVMEKCNHHDFPLSHMELSGFKGATELFSHFVQLQHLSITYCATLLHWPEKEFQSLVSLRSLQIWDCRNLVGYAQAPAAEPTTVSESPSQLLPRLECLSIKKCERMVEIFKLPASLREISIDGCDKLKYILSRMPHEGHSALTHPQLSPVYSASSAVTRQELFLFPCLEEIDLQCCPSLTGVLDLPPSLKRINLLMCDQLRSLESHSGEFPALEGLFITGCETLSYIPDMPQAYPSLKSCRILSCPGIKRLPKCLEERLSSLWDICIDRRYEGPILLKPKTWRYAIWR